MDWLTIFGRVLRTLPCVNKLRGALPRALVARRTGICLCSRRDGVRDGSGNRAAGADASTPRGFPTGCCEYRLAARWWRCGETAVRNMLCFYCAYTAYIL